MESTASVKVDILRAESAGPIYKQANGYWRFDVVYTLADGRKAADYKVHKLKRDAVADFATFPKNVNNKRAIYHDGRHIGTETSYYIGPEARGGVMKPVPNPSPSPTVWSLDSEVFRAVEAAFADRAFAFTESYLYYSPGRLAIACTNPAGMTIGSPERVPLGKCRTGLREWVMERARRLPCLPAE